MEGQYLARLFDVSHTLARLIGIDAREIAELIEVHRGGLTDEFIGKPIVA